MLTPKTAAEFRDRYLQTDWRQLDCLGEVSGVGTYEQVLQESTEIELAAGPCRILSINALIRAKEAMGRPRDREAIVQLRAIPERTSGE